jgi:hypothetical protein
MVNVPSTAQTLSDDYVKMGTWIGLATDDPGNSPTPANEVTADGYQRQQTTWMADAADDAGVYQGVGVKFTLPAGSYSYMLLCKGPDTTMDPMMDYAKIDATLNTDGEIVVIPTYTQT